ncbi:RNA methyltransferase [Mesorhizobium sp. VK9D]|uniref:TrmH family RNA methyltransferase n=1 Tax=Mesorhizobium australafricanum TaxID=3072311 RepID=UPI002A23F7AF|nr:RNA methyltransferase [Mesorhizobium sp. VK9D]MDX8454354.1 RNA methyltransferase [Mesorhizobium sp. VK9D]
MNLIPIDDPQDPRVAAYLDIRERDLVGRHGRFVAEGKVVLDLLLSTGRFSAESALILENRLAGLQAVLRKAPPDFPVYVAAGEVMDRIAGFHMHRGILAIGIRGDPAPAEVLVEALPQHASVVVLVGISNHDNVGAIFRNAAAFGADAVLLDQTCCDPLYRKAIRVSVGAALKVPFASFGDSGTFIATLDRLGFSQFALSPRGNVDIRAAERSARLALYLGTEGEGLPPDMLAQLHTVRIGMAEGFDSLNVAAASAIALHHFSKASLEPDDFRSNRPEI